MTTNTPFIEVTDSAAEKLREVLDEQDKSAGLLRIMVMPSSGCGGGLQYVLGVEDTAEKDDLVIKTPKVDILIDSQSAPLIDGSSIDYVDGLMRSGFVISNPNQPATGGCACGGGGCGCGGGSKPSADPASVESTEETSSAGGCGSGACGCGGGSNPSVNPTSAESTEETSSAGGCGSGACGCGGGSNPSVNPTSAESTEETSSAGGCGSGACGCGAN